MPIEPETTFEIVGIYLVATHSTYRAIDGPFLLTNDAPYGVRITVERIVPPAPPLICGDLWSDSDEDEIYMHCTAPGGHIGPHTRHSNGRNIWWEGPLA